MAAFGCVLTRLFYRTAVLNTFTKTHNSARFVRCLGEPRASRALFTHSDGSDVEAKPRDSSLQSKQQHVFNLDVLVALLREENAVDLCVIKVPNELKYTQYFIIVTGSSTRHLRAMSQYSMTAYKILRRDSDPHTHIEGRDCEDWMCVDLGSVVVHFMLPETREKFQLETLWALRSYDQLTNNTLPHTLPPDFILTHTHTSS